MSTVLFSILGALLREGFECKFEKIPGIHSKWPLLHVADFLHSVQKYGRRRITLENVCTRENSAQQISTLIPSNFCMQNNYYHIVLIAIVEAILLLLNAVRVKFGS